MTIMVITTMITASLHSAFHQPVESLGRTPAGWVRLSPLPRPPRSADEAGETQRCKDISQRPHSKQTFDGGI